MWKRISLFLAFITFFNFVFASANRAYSSTSSSGGNYSSNGLVPRIRKFKQIYLTYSKGEGFVCEPEGLRDYMGLGDINKDNIGESFEKIGYAILEAIVRAIIFPIKCAINAAIIAGIIFGIGTDIADSAKSKFSNSDDGDSINTAEVATGILVVFDLLLELAESAFDQWISSVRGEDDLMSDSTNTFFVCTALVSVNNRLCLTWGIVLPVLALLIKSGEVLKGIIGIGAAIAMAVVIDALITMITQIAYPEASKNFPYFSLCGDEWLTYGNAKLEEEIQNFVDFEDSNKRYFLISNSISGSHYSNDFFLGKSYGAFSETSTIVNDVSKSFASLPTAAFATRNLPMRGAFPGSYKFLLKKCFSGRISDACKRIFRGGFDVGKINKNFFADEDFDIDELRDEQYQPYREFTYGGMEYGYSGCADPRPERIGYKMFANTDGGNNSSQLYYFKGSDPPNFACERFATSNDEDYRNAFECCIQASQNYVCIQSIKAKDNDYPERQHVFCDVEEQDFEKCNLPKIEHNVSNDIITVIAQIWNQMSGEQFKTSIENAVSEVNSEESNGSKVNVETIASISSLGMSDSITKTMNEIESKSIQFYIRKSAFSPSKYCVETRNLCPYNFTLKGGSEYYGNEFLSYTNGIKLNENKDGEDTDNEKTIEQNEIDHCIFEEAVESGGGEDGIKFCPGLCFEPDGPGAGDGEYLECYGKPSNICQVDRHCVTLPPLLEIEYASYSPFIDKACMNFMGSSNNFSNYRNIPIYRRDQITHSKNLFAPFVECFVETFKHMLLNEAGHTKCIKENEAPIGDDGAPCASGVKYLMGDELDDDQSPFLKMKKKLINITRAMMTLSVMFYGFKVIIKKDDKKGGIIIDTKDLAKRILTMIFVIYVSTSAAWVRPMFKMVFGLYNGIINFTSRIMLNTEDNNFYNSFNFPGCYFFDNEFINNNYKNYGDRTYMAVFDTLDCKLSMYLGFFGDDITEPPILGFIFAAIFSFGIIIILVFPFFVMFLGLIILAARIAYVFIKSSFECVLLLLVTPIVAPMMLFDRTKKIFDSWIKEIVGTLFSSVFLIMSTSVFFTVFDKNFVGDAKFIGNKAPLRDVYCGKICKVSENSFYFLNKTTNEEENICKNDNKGEVINLEWETVICALDFDMSVSSTKITVIDFLVENAVRFAQLTMLAAHLFNLFIDVIFLLILIFLFDQFVQYASNMNKTIFGKGFDFDGVVPSFKDASGSLAKGASALANFGKEMDRLPASLIQNRREKIDKEKDESGKPSKSPEKEGPKDDNGEKDLVDIDNAETSDDGGDKDLVGIDNADDGEESKDKGDDKNDKKDDGKDGGDLLNIESATGDGNES
jgi:type IV secretory pathway VirB6-like protein